MSRAYKNSLVDEADDLSTGAFDSTGVEKLSGADLEQARLAALNGSNPAVSAGGVVTPGTNLQAVKLATVTADGVNTVTVDDTSALYVGQVVDIVSSAGVSRADNRTLTAINYVTKVATYNGADASASVVATDLVIVSTGPRSNTELSGADLERFAGDQ